MSPLLSQRPGQRTLATAHLAQTMALIGLPSVELEATVAAELAANPALELVAEIRCPACGRPVRHLPCPACERDRPQADGPIVYLSARNYGGREFGNGFDEDRPEASEPVEPEKLAEHVLRQIAPAMSSADRPIAAYLLTRIDERGFLPEAPAESAQFLRAPLQRVEAVLSLIQHADPPGLGAQNTRESLLLQIEALEEDEAMVDPLARICISGHWEALCRRDLGRIARALGVPRDDVVATVAFIRRNLTPYPAQAFWGDGRGRAMDDSSSRFTGRPDAIISRPADGRAGPLRVEVFTPVEGWLRVDPTFKAALAEREVEGEEREAWERYVARAQLFAKCLRQRNNTMCRLLEVIAREQEPFILGGDRDLKPMTRASLATRLGVHESTVSRAVAAKAIALPDGRMVPLAKFFDRSLSVRDAVKTIVAGEGRPLTDDEIAARLWREGYRVARRTVAKYRAAEGILPAAARARAATPVGAAGGRRW
jgi:RNA polymerase sigma-54 factor